MLCSRWIGPILVLCLLSSAAVHAQVKQAAEARLNLLNKKAMDEYDTLEFEAAKAALVEAIGVARSAGLTGGSALTQTYLDLGIVFGAGLNDRINAIKYFTAALRVDPDAVLDPARATPALEEMFEAARQKVVAEPPPPPPGPQFRHTPVDEAVGGRPVQIYAQVGGDVQSVLLFFRTMGTTEFRRVPMQQVKPGLFRGTIPGNLVRGRSIYYYVEAQNVAGERMAGHGTAMSPNIISVQEGAGPGPGPGPGKPTPRPSRKVFSIGLMVGAGLGIVNGGQSEHTHLQSNGKLQPVDINPGGALAPFHLAPELSYHINDKWHISALGRIQVINAIDSGNTISLLGELRAKRFFGDGNLRFYMAFGAGAGQMRHRIPLGDYDGDASTPDNEVDARVAGIGAFGLGGGMSYMFSSYVGFALEINGLIMVPDFAANLDANSGLILAF